MYNSSLVGKVALTGIGVIDIIPYIYDKCMSLSKIADFAEIKKTIKFKTNRFVWSDGGIYIEVTHNIPQLNVHANMDVDKYSLIRDKRQVDFDRFEPSDTNAVDIDLFEEFSTTTAREVIDLDSGKRKTLVQINGKWFAASSVQAMVDCVHFFTRDINDAKWTFLSGVDKYMLNVQYNSKDNTRLVIYLLDFDLKRKL